VDRLDFDFGGIGQKRANDQTRTAAQRLHSQQHVRRLMHQPNQAVQFIFGQQHDDKRLAEFFHQGTIFINRDLCKTGVAAFGIPQCGTDNSIFRNAAVCRHAATMNRGFAEVSNHPGWG
jgi:hypothetical protein